MTRAARISGSALLAAWSLLASAPPASAHELKDVSLITAAGQTQVKLSFAAQGSEGDYPLYAQKTDLTKGTLFLSFLETETSLPLGRHPLDAKAPAIEEILLKKVTTPSGKSMLGLEFKFRQAPLGDAVVEPAPKGVLKMMLGKGKGKYAWSLAGSLKAGDAYLSAGAAAPPAHAAAGAKIDKLEKAAQAASPAPAAREEAVRAEPVTPTVPSEPGIPGETAPPGEGTGTAGENAAAPAASSAHATLTEVKMIVTSSQADLLLVLDPPAAPVFRSAKDAKDSSWLVLTLDNAGSALAKKEYALPKNPVYKRIKTMAKGNKLILRVQTAAGEAVQTAPAENGLALSGPVHGPAAPAFKWTSLKPDAKESESVAETTEEPVPSAHEEGQALDAGKGGKGLSSSRIFSVGRGAKAMVMYKDSAALKSAPGPKGTLIRKIAIGEKLVRLDNQAGNLRVAAGNDTGYIKAGEAVYEDELTKVQEKTIQGRIEAKEAMIAAAQAKAAAAEAKAAALKAKQEEKARKAEELALKKAADKAAADSAKALAKAQALEKTQAKAQAKADAKAQALAQAQAKAQPPAEPQDLQAAAAPSAPGAPKTADRNPVPAEPAGDASGANPAGQPAAGGPKLAIADNPELAAKLAQEKLAAEEEKKRIEPEENRVSYNSYGRRDPFIPVEQGSIDNGIDIDQMKVVGIIWQAQQPMAVLEHNREAGVSFTIKEGDPVHNGRVAHITRDAVTFDISEYGISRSYSLKLVSSKEGAKK